MGCGIQKVLPKSKFAASEPLEESFKNSTQKKKPMISSMSVANSQS